jgi:UDP-4-amino-4,6-dideoxy-N-acetyl-beta-L-altrosamine transaminase
MLSYGRQSISEDDIKAVVDVLTSDFLTQGPRVQEFEQKVAARVGAAHAVAANSATSALHLACMGFDLKPGDIVWTSPNSFVASANCALYCGSSVDFVDIDPSTYNMCVSHLEEKLKSAELVGKLPKLVIPVHMCGQSCDMEAIHRLSARYGFRIIEDASHAIGATYKGQPVGSCKYSDVCIFSFHPVKIITTGEGGMAVTNNSDIADKMNLLRSHGVTRDSAQFVRPTYDMGSWYYQQVALGFNYRMCDIQAALGVSQLDSLDEFIHKRNEIALQYNHRLKDHKLLSLPTVSPDCLSSFHLYIVRVMFSSSFSKADLFDKMREAGVALNCHYIPIHTQPYYKSLGFRVGDFPNAEEYYSAAITLPLHPTMSQKAIDLVIQSLSASLQ